MKFSCCKSDLTEALQFVIRAVAVKPQTPITSGIYLKAEGARLELQANNFSTGIVTHIPVNTEIPGETVVSGKRFLEFARKLPDDTVTFSEEDNALRLSSGGANVDLLTMAPEDFPKVKSVKAPQGSFKVSASTLRNLIRRTVFAVAKDDSRPIFTGIQFDIDGENISAVATNTHRLAFAKDKLDEPSEQVSFIMSGATANDLLSCINPTSTDFITVNYAVGSIAFEIDDTLITSRLIEGTFPDWNKVVPKETATQITVDTTEFRRVVDFISLMSKETEHNTVKFVVEGNDIEISSNSPQIGGAEQSIEAQFAGEGVEISFNVNYILDALKVVDSERLKLEFNDRFSPCMITEPDNPNFIYVATPVRT